MESEDHREKNILLAKNLNQVKMDLRCRKRDIVSLQTQLHREQQRNTKMESDQVAIVNRIHMLKQQLDDTFMKNTFGYINLSKQLDQMHNDSIQSIGNTSMISPSTVTNTPHSLFLEKIKQFSESLVSLDGDNVDESLRLLNDSQVTHRRHSLSFNSFEIDLNSTFVKDAESDDSQVNDTVSTNQSENMEVTLPLQNIEGRTLLCNEARKTNITMRRAKAERMATSETPKTGIKSSKHRSRRHKENRSSNISPFKKMILRRAKKIDYNETSFWRSK